MEMPRKKKVIIYGLGKKYKGIESVISKYEIIGVCDKNSKKKDEYENYIDKDALGNVKYDYIMITSDDYYDEIFEELLEMGIPGEKIIGIMHYGKYNAMQGIRTDRKDRVCTSITDNDYYPELCKKAIDDEELFSSFRSNYIYVKTLEHVDYIFGKKYLDILLAENFFVEKDYINFFKNDMVGDPMVYDYKIGKKDFACAPTTLRYIKELQDLCLIHGNNDAQNVVEIGVGYGGLCRIVSSYWSHLATYTLIDLPEAIELTKKYLSNFEVAPDIKYINGIDEFPEVYSDLVISNYAFSELKKEVQKKYLDKVVLNSRHGYITWNNMSAEMLDGYTIEEILSIIPNATIIDENPKTALNNCIIIW